MTADQPLVTHADLEPLRHARAKWLDGSIVAAVLDRLIAHAEADKPALPEGWVVLDFPPGGPRVLWHSDGQLYVRREDDMPLGEVHWGNRRDRLTPLVTAASLAPEGWHVGEDGEGRPTVWDADNLVILGRVARGADPLFDVLAALVTAAQAERGESR